MFGGNKHIEIPRRNLIAFKSWLVNQPEYQTFKNTFVRQEEQEKLLTEMYNKFLNEKESK